MPYISLVLYPIFHWYYALYFIGIIPYISLVLYPIFHWYYTLYFIGIIPLFHWYYALFLCNLYCKVTLYLLLNYSSI